MLLKILIVWTVLHMLCVDTINGYTCLHGGNYPNPNVTDCSSFIMCAGNLNIGFTFKIKTCPIGSVFNKRIGQCDDRIQCDTGMGNELTTSTTLQPSLFICPNVGRYADPDSLDCRGFIRCFRNADRTLSYRRYDCAFPTIFNSETQICVNRSDFTCKNSPNILYDCKMNGYFTDKSSLDCTKYFFCHKKLDLEFMVVSRTCPNGFLFNEAKYGCVLAATYDCPLGKQEIEFNCPDEGFYLNIASDNCKTYYHCSRNASGDLVHVLLECDNNMIFDNVIRMCVISDTGVCITEPPSEGFMCPDNGFFADHNTPYCQGYFHCIRNNNDNKFSIVLNICPQGSFFTPTDKTCVTVGNNICPSLEKLDQGFNCLDTGNYVSYSTDDCRTYYKCSRSISGELTYKFLACDFNKVFHSMHRYCVHESLYECKKTPEIPTNEFNCPGIGNYTDLKSTNCMNYYFCTRNNIIYSLSYVLLTCPIGNVYDPILKRCVDQANYVCPTVEVTTTELTITTEVGVPDELISTTVSVTEEVTDEVSVPEETSSTTTGTPIQEFECVADGLFPNNSSADCTEYYRCVGSVKYNITCAPGTIFYPFEKMCVHNTMFTCSSLGVNYNCASVGSVLDPISTDCTTYYICIAYEDSFISLKQRCPDGMIFKTDVSTCVLENDYVCQKFVVDD